MRGLGKTRVFNRLLEKCENSIHCLTFPIEATSSRMPLHVLAIIGGSTVATVSANFAFLETYDPQLVRLSGLAERYFADDPNGCLVKLRMFGELLATIVAARYGLMESPDETQADRLRRFKDRGALSQQVFDLFHGVQIRERRRSTTSPTNAGRH